MNVRGCWAAELHRPARTWERAVPALDPLRSPGCPRHRAAGRRKPGLQSPAICQNGVNATSKTGLVVWLLLVLPYGTRMISSVGSVLDSGECGSGATGSTSILSESAEKPQQRQDACERTAACPAGCAPRWDTLGLGLDNDSRGDRVPTITRNLSETIQPSRAPVECVRAYEKGMPAGMGPAAPLKVSDSV